MGLSARSGGRRIVFTGLGEVAVEEFALPASPDPGHVLIQGAVSLVSPGTETAVLHGRVNPGFPHYPGYSYTGVVLAVGEGVERTGPGDRVYVQARHASHVHVPADTPTLLPVPPEVSFTDAAFTTLYAVALYAVRRAAIVVGESVAILGAGLVGQLALRLVRLVGADPLVVTDVKPERLKAALDHGADRVADLSQEPTADVVACTYGSEGFDVVIDATGSPKALPQGLALARRRGRVVLLGSPHGPATLEDLFDQFDDKDITLIGAHQPNNPPTGSLTYPWSQRRERELVLGLMSRAKLDTQGIPFLQTTPADAPAAYARLGATGEQAFTCLITWDH